MNLQSELPLFRRPRRDHGRDLAALKSWLTKRGWQNAGVIEHALGFNDRYTRLLANLSNGEIISGRGGYKITRESTIDEIRTSRNGLRSQAREMIRRSIQIDRVWHGGR